MSYNYIKNNFLKNIKESELVLGVNSTTEYFNKEGEELHMIFLDVDDSPIEKVHNEIKKKQTWGFVLEDGSTIFLGDCWILKSSESVQNIYEEGEMVVIKHHLVFFNDWYPYHLATKIVKSFGTADPQFKDWRDKRDTMCLRISMKNDYIPTLADIIKSPNRQPDMKIFDKNKKEVDLYAAQESKRKAYFILLQLEQKAQIKPTRITMFLNEIREKKQ